MKGNSKIKLLQVKSGPMLNTYPDSLGGNLGSIIKLLLSDEFKDVFQSLYILPSIFNSDLDRGFSVINYELDSRVAVKQDLEELKKHDITLKLDFVLNHSSVRSFPFQDILRNGKASKYIDFFIDWNKFWDGYGKMTDDGYIQPDPHWIKDMFFRKPGLPLLKVRIPPGNEVFFWNTFYQEISYAKVKTRNLMKALGISYKSAAKLTEIINRALDGGKKPSEIDLGKYSQYRNTITEILESGRKYLGQLDLNIRSPLVWEFYKDTLVKLAGYGAQIIRLDAVAYVSKKPGARNFFNEPETWEILEGVRRLADKSDLIILPEIHSAYKEKIFERLHKNGYLTYDFFLPGLIIHALEIKSNEFLLKWARCLKDNGIRVVNMLGCHDGIPLMDLEGLIPDEQIQWLIDIIVQRGGLVKDLYGKQKIYYQVNATYYSALGENDSKLLLARAIQIFMPGIPLVWYLDLFAGKNNHDAVNKAGPSGHKEINRTNLSIQQIYSDLKKPVVNRQLELLRFRNSSPAFGFDSELEILDSEQHELRLRWNNKSYSANLFANLKDYSFHITAENDKGKIFDVKY